MCCVASAPTCIGTPTGSMKNILSSNIEMLHDTQCTDAYINVLLCVILMGMMIA